MKSLKNSTKSMPAETSLSASAIIFSASDISTADPSVSMPFSFMALCRLCFEIWPVFLLSSSPKICFSFAPLALMTSKCVWNRMASSLPLKIYLLFWIGAPRMSLMNWTSSSVLFFAWMRVLTILSTSMPTDGLSLSLTFLITISARSSSMLALLRMPKGVLLILHLKLRMVLPPENSTVALELAEFSLLAISDKSTGGGGGGTLGFGKAGM
mmetsp:Transcript_26370/g.49920  ORF Transcript_26370/g.49920 Transcript_26370/m.49920 type:complete len:212 (-) Transcript_26370:271-906(-)